MTVRAEVGSDRSPGKSEGHRSSGLNRAPPRDVRGGRVIRHTRQHRSPRGRNAFAHGRAIAAPESELPGRSFSTPPPKWGGVIAVKARAPILACLFSRLLTKGQTGVDRGTVEFEVRRQQREFAALQRQARDLGRQLVPTA